MDVVIGNGNLAQALLAKLKKKRHKVLHLSRSLGHSVSALTKIDKATSIWYTVGHGSVGEADRDTEGAFKWHASVPITIARSNPKAKFNYFSTDYAKEVRSVYAVSKKSFEVFAEMERDLDITVYRVTSLYGKYKPEKTFIHRLLAHNTAGDICLPSNEVCPTPVDWIACEICKNLNQKERFVEICPSGSTTVAKWGEMILGKKVVAIGTDKSRPRKLTLEHSFSSPKSWEELWLSEEAFWKGYVREFRLRTK